MLDVGFWILEAYPFQITYLHTVCMHADEPKNQRPKKNQETWFRIILVFTLTMPQPYSAV